MVTRANEGALMLMDAALIGVDGSISPAAVAAAYTMVAAPRLRKAVIPKFVVTACRTPAVRRACEATGTAAADTASDLVAELVLAYSLALSLLADATGATPGEAAENVAALALGAVI
jgi:hypothetical protein